MNFDIFASVQPDSNYIMAIYCDKLAVLIFASYRVWRQLVKRTFLNTFKYKSNRTWFQKILRGQYLVWRNFHIVILAKGRHSGASPGRNRP